MTVNQNSLNIKAWEQFLFPYVQAVEELKIKLKGIRKEYKLKDRPSPIEFVTGRVKPIPSILDKAQRRGISRENIEDKMYDIAGLRLMCQFTNDIDVVVKMLRERHDFKIIEERDYISNKKESGYRSYHVIIKYPIETAQGTREVLAEIQIRTLAMNFWATIEHSLNYKYDGDYPNAIRQKLQKAAEAAALLDDEMSEIREEILEAQKYFDRYR